MAKLSRVFQRIFGSNAGANQLAQWGSLAAGTPAFSTDPSVIQSLSNWLTGWFGGIVGANSPAIEDMNSFCFVVTRQLAEIFQDGVPPWETNTTYYIGSFASSNGVIYQSIKDSNVGNAVTNTNFWKTAFSAGLNPQVTSVLAARATATWPAGTTPETNQIEDICWSPELNLFCSVSSSGSIGAHLVYTSPDGITWTNRTAAAVKEWTGVCWSPELHLFVAVAQDNATNNIMTSPDGITWTLRTVSFVSEFFSVCWSPELGIFCAIAITGGAVTSPDGITWTSRVMPPFQWAGVCWSPELELFCAVARDGAAATSPNGITWTARTTPNQAWFSICWSKDQGAFVAIENGNVGMSMISYDGINWVQNALPDAGELYAKICWSPELGLFVATSQTGTHRISTSRNGINWIGVNTGSLIESHAIAWSPKLGIFVSLPIDTSGISIYSKYVQKLIAP